MGLEVAAKRMAQAGLPAADALTVEQIRAWIDGVLDGFHQVGGNAKGIRVSNSLFDSMVAIQDASSNNFYRGYPFAADPRLWPNSEVQVVLS